MSDVPRLLPPNASPAEYALEQATARIGDVPTPTRTLWDPDTCPANLLPWLAWTYSVDRWSKDWSEATKRQAIRDSIEIHRRKGTVASLKRAIEALGYSIAFVEWWQSEGSDLDPHEFRATVDTSGLGLTLEQSRVVFEIIDSTKPLRSHMADIAFSELVPPADAYVGAVPFDGAYSYHVAEVGALPVPGIPDGSLALVGETAPYSIWRYQEDIEEWFALLVYADELGDLPTDVREGALALVGTDPDLEAREVYVYTGSSWLLAGEPRVVVSSLLAGLPAAAGVKVGTVGVVGDAPTQELHISDGLAWVASLLYRATTGALPATARDGAMALVGSSSPLRTREAYLYEEAAWHLLTGSAGPPGEATVWGSVGDWSELSTLPTGELRTGDRVLVGDLGVVGTSYGFAEYEDGVWYLRQGIFSTLIGLRDFAHDVVSGAIAFVGTGVATDPMYYFDGTDWRRMSYGTPWAYTLSSLFDFSATGLQDGDYGVFTPAGGAPILLRYKAECPYASTAGTGTRQMWVPPQAYAGTGLQIDCYAIGSENNTALAAQGLAVTQTNTGTVSSVGGYIRLNAPAVGSSNSVAQLTAPAITGATKWWLTCEIRGGGTGASWAGGLFQSSGQAITQWSWAHLNSLNNYVQPLYWTTTWAASTTALNLQAGGRAFPSVSSTPWLVQALAAGALSDQIPTTVDGLLYSQFRRDADGAGSSTSYTLAPQAVGGISGTSAQIDLRHFFRLTWT